LDERIKIKCRGFSHRDITLVSQKSNTSVGCTSYPATAGSKATWEFSYTSKEAIPLLTVLTANYFFSPAATKLAICNPCTQQASHNKATVLL